MSIRMSEMQSPIHRQSTNEGIQVKRQSIVKLTDLDMERDIGGDALFQANYETSWTIADQHRLLAIDRLQTRTLEYHNNIHDKVDMHESTAENDDCVAQLLFCSMKGSDRPFPITKAKLSSTLSQIRQKEAKDDKSLTWIHLFDLSELNNIASIYDIHPLCIAGLKDLRSHSNIIQSSTGGFVITMCYFHLGDINVQLFKMYFYIAKGVIITFVAELMPDTEIELDEDDEYASSTVCNVVMEKWTTIIKKSCEMGPMYIFYEIGTEAIKQQDSLIEFFSRTLFFFKKKTSLSLSHRKKVAFMRKMHIVISAIQLVEFNTQSIANIFAALVKKGEADAALIEHTSSTGGLVMPLIPCCLVGREQLPYLYDVSDNCDFMYACLKKEANEARVLTDAMDAVTQLKANNTAMLLSLVATIFLPVTFLTGVFGMNFSVDGGFTIDLVNSPYGPGVFYVMCGIVVIVILTYFITKGWIELYSVRTYFERLLCCFSGPAVDTDIDGETVKPLPRKMSEAPPRKMSDAPPAGPGLGLKKTPSMVINKPSQPLADPLVPPPQSSSPPKSIRGSLARDSISMSAKYHLDRAIEEDNRRAAEANRKRNHTKEMLKFGGRNSTARFSIASTAEEFGSVRTEKPFD